jgi:hypothetical protein
VLALLFTRGVAPDDEIQRWHFFSSQGYADSTAIWPTNFLHDTNTVHRENKEHSTTVLARAVQYLLSAIRFCVKTCI